MKLILQQKNKHVLAHHQVIRFCFYNICNKTFLTLIILYFLTLSTNRRLTRLQKQSRL